MLYLFEIAKCTTMYDALVNHMKMVRLKIIRFLIIRITSSIHPLKYVLCAFWWSCTGRKSAIKIQSKVKLFFPWEAAKYYEFIDLDDVEQNYMHIEYRYVYQSEYVQLISKPAPTCNPFDTIIRRKHDSKKCFI